MERVGEFAILHPAQTHQQEVASKLLEYVPQIVLLAIADGLAENGIGHILADRG
jgi:hypothetical protein